MFKRVFLFLLIIFLFSNVYSTNNTINETFNAVNSSNQLNYGENLGDVSADFAVGNNNFTSLSSFHYSNDEAARIFDQRIELYGGEFNYALRDEVVGITNITDGVFYSNDTTFAVYNFTFDTSLNLSHNSTLPSKLLGGEMNILGEDYILVGISNDSDGNVTGINISRGFEVEMDENFISYNYSNGSETFNISIPSVDASGALIGVNGVFDYVEEYETKTIGNLTLTIKDVVFSTNNNVNSDVFVLLSSKLYEFKDNSSLIKVNGFNVTDVFPEYKVLSNFGAPYFTGFNISYKVENDTLLQNGSCLYDYIFNAFRLCYNGEQNHTKGSLHISVNDDEINFNGLLFINNTFNKGVVYTSSTNGIDGTTYIKGNQDTDRVFTSESIFLNLSTDIGTNGITSVNSTGENSFNIGDSITNLTFNFSNTGLDGSGFFHHLDNGTQQHYYEFQSINTINKTVDFNDHIYNVEQAGINVTGVSNQLNSPISGIGSNFTLGVLYLPLSTLGAPLMTFKNRLLVDIGSAENRTGVGGWLTLSLDGDNITSDNLSDEDELWNVTFSWDTGDAEFNIEVNTTENDFVNYANADNVNGSTALKTFVTSFGTQIVYDNSSNSYVTIKVPSEQIYANATMQFGEFNVSTSSNLTNNNFTLRYIRGNHTNISHYVLCNNCSLINITYGNYSNYTQYTLSNLTGGFPNLITNFTSSKITDNLIAINYGNNTNSTRKDLFSVLPSGFFRVNVNVNVSGSVQSTAFNHIQDFRIDITALDDNITDLENLTLNLSFDVEPPGDYITNNTITFSIEQSNNTFSSTTGVLVVNGSGSHVIGMTSGSSSNFNTSVTNWNKVGFFQVNEISGINFVDYFNFTVRGTEPVMNITFPVSSSNNNVTKSSLDLIATFNKPVEKLTYFDGTETINLTRLFNGNNSVNITLPVDFGENTLNFSFTDEINQNGTQYIAFNTTLFLNGTTDDFDGDGVNDTIDTVIGDTQNVFTNVNNLSVRINSSTNLSQVFNTTTNISFFDGGEIVVEFENNFSSNSINLTNVILKDEEVENNSRVIVSGLDLDGGTKTIYLDLLGNTSQFSSICIKDAEIEDFSQISATCNGTNETYVHQIPITVSNYTLNFTNSSNTTVKIEGLRNSGVSQTCTEDWSYSSFSTCSGGTQSRTATDANSCGTTFNQSFLSQSCTVTSTGGGGGGGGSSGSSNDDDESDIVQGGTFFVDQGSSSTDSTTDATPVENKVKVPTTSVKNSFDLLINGNAITTDGDFSGIKKVKVRDKSSNVDAIEFDYDFSKGELDLSKLAVQMGEVDNYSYVVVSGLDLYVGATKTVTFAKKNDYGYVCILDRDVENYVDVSSGCNSTDEFLIQCDGGNYNGYTCGISSENYVVSGLKNSQILEFEFVETNTTVSSEIVKFPETTGSKDSNTLLIIILLLIIAAIGFFVYKNKDNNTGPREEVEDTRSKDDTIVTASIKAPVSRGVDADISEIMRVHGLSEVDAGKYKVIREYFKEYESNFSKYTLYETLIDNNFPDEIVAKVFEELYNEKI